jgi:hypothetical protein
MASEFAECFKRSQGNTRIDLYKEPSILRALFLYIATIQIGVGAKKDNFWNPNFFCKSHI